MLRLCFAADIKAASLRLASLTRPESEAGGVGWFGEGISRCSKRGATLNEGSVAPFGSLLVRNKPKRLAKKLLQIREALGLSQKEMAERLGIYRTHHHISKYERAKAVPFMEVLLAYARLANVTSEQIVDDDLDLEPTEWPEFIEVDLT